jgi:hypothetical protein
MHNRFPFIIPCCGYIFQPSGPSSGNTGAVSEAKLYVKVYIELHFKYIKLH